MSELVTTRPHTDTRLRLLATVSALSLLTVAASQAKAEDADRPTVWIELGGQLEHLANAQDDFVPPFLLGAAPLGPRPNFPVGINPNPAQLWPGAVLVEPPDQAFDRSGPLAAQSPPPNTFGGEAKLSFRPHGSDWVVSAGVRYGRAVSSKKLIEHTADRPVFYGGGTINPAAQRNFARFYEADGDFSQSQTVVDFQVGKDVGLGLFGSNSTISAGVRFAQFASKSAVSVNEVPQFQAYNYQLPFGTPPFNKYQTRFQFYQLAAHSTRSFHGVGPSLSWNGSVPVAGNIDTAEIAFDFGLNGAVLFGRQKAQVDHATSADDGVYKFGYHAQYPIRVARYALATQHRRSHAVTSPNIGGFAGLSLVFPNAKISVGYRADFFFGAMDAGIDERRSEDMGFYGPFAKISIGLGG